MLWSNNWYLFNSSISKLTACTFSLCLYNVMFHIFHECIVNMMLIFTQFKIEIVLFWSEKKNINRHVCAAGGYSNAPCFIIPKLQPIT